MTHSLVPVLLLATAALSSSNVLPMLSEIQQGSDPLDADSQHNDNIFSSRFNIKDVLDNLFYNGPSARGTSRSELPTKRMSKYDNTNNNRAADRFDGVIVDKEDNYDGKGFRKEQWHNYPRQLDRLHKYLFEHRISDFLTNSDTDDGDNINDAPESDGRIDDVATKEFLLDSSDSAHNIYDAVVAANNPLLILKLHLTCLNNELRRPTKYDQLSFETENDVQEKGQEEELFTNEINPAIKVKREESHFEDTSTSGDNPTGRKKAVKKRLFSLWSRLQSLSHKGHEIPHRRHPHAFYGFPDADGGGGGGVLTAQTRATLMRPPGSPLRWG